MKAVAIGSKCQLKLIDAEKPQVNDSKLVIKVEKPVFAGRTFICGTMEFRRV